jgi:quercetin dioxygenase-like cupin family protein
MFVVHGDPTKPGLFAIRLKLSAGHKIKPHFHPSDENVTVLSGGPVSMAIGDSYDEKAASKVTVPVGGFFTIPAQAHHYAWNAKDTIIQIHAMGPFTVTYVNPDDDPLKAAAKK